MAENERKLTEKQDLIFQFIKESIRDSGFPPTVREIGDRFNITVKGAYDHLKAIEKKGYIKTEQNKSRAIVITDSEVMDAPSITIPLVGRIAAGNPVLAQENIDDYLSFPQGAFGKGDFFALRVKGDSMIEGGIFDGDLAIIKKQNTANNGDIIAALIDDEATLKRYKNEKGRVELVPENSAYKPFIPDNLVILGKLSAVFRTY